MITAKLKAYGVDENSLRLMRNYLSQRQQRWKRGSSLSEWLEIILGLPRESILGPILINVFTNYLYLFRKETGICNFAHDSILYASGKDLGTISNMLELETTTAINGLTECSNETLSIFWRNTNMKNQDFLKWINWNFFFVVSNGLYFLFF